MAQKTGEETEIHHTPEKELACVVLHAGEMSDVTLLKDYLQMTKVTGELNVNEPDSKGYTPLHFAVATKKLDIVKTLVEYGANVNFRNEMGFTPLFWATGRYADPQIANYLILKGRASVHITTDTGVCALHGAALQGNLDCISLLLKHGADVRCSDHNGNTPLDLAKDSDTKKFLLKAMQIPECTSENSDSCCDQCGLKDTNLKRCSKCFVARYCSRECQTINWKAGHRQTCSGFVLGRIKGSQDSCFTTLINHHTLRITQHDLTAKKQLTMDDVEKKKFIMKVQVPMISGGPGLQDSQAGDMMCYNEDRSVTGFITSSEKGYSKLRSVIAKNGYMGVKAYFWAELDLAADDGSFRVFHGNCAPYQSW